jgi:hypothetical protein
MQNKAGWKPAIQNVLNFYFFRLARPLCCASVRVLCDATL